MQQILLQELDRLCSHQAAGPGPQCFRASSRRCSRTCSSRTRCQAQFNKAGKHSSDNTFRLERSGWPEKVQLFVSRGNVLKSFALQTIDYSFYRTLEVEITPEYLWEDRLAPLLGYLSHQHAAHVYDALIVAFKSHDGQHRKSGEPFITHPVEVTRILAELRMDHESLIAGLLHDTVEDTDTVSFEDIGTWFGPSVRKIVEGETKFSKIKKLTAVQPPQPLISSASSASSNASLPGSTGASNASSNTAGTTAASSEQSSAPVPPAAAVCDPKALDLQQLFLSMTEEVRIIVVKLADRLHNMRTLDSMPPHKQKRIADETLAVFAPLARQLGLYSVKEELEDLSFRYSNPTAHTECRAKLDVLQEEQRPVLEEARKVLEDTLAKDTYLLSRVDGYAVEVHHKSLYSVYKRAKAKKVDFKEISDVSQLRVVLKERSELRSSLLLGGTSAQLCYHVIGVVHGMWAPVPGSMKDYIATPKPNGYQSLHTVVLPLGSRRLFPLEVQIRTEEMQRYAEYGIAGENWGGGNKVLQYLEKAQDQQLTGQTLDSVNNGNQPVAGVNGTAINGAHVNGASVSGTSAAVNGTRVNGSHINGVRLDPAQVPGLRGTMMPNVDGDALYKSGVRYNNRVEQRELVKRINWLDAIRQWQDEFLGTITAREFVDCVTDDLLSQGVFVYTPKGDVLHLPKGATVIDFAYHVHTDVGNRMAYARVNGQQVHPSHTLASAEVVEIVTNSGDINRNHVDRLKRWLPFAKTRSARHKLSRFLSKHGALSPTEEPTTAASVLGSVDELLSSADEDEVVLSPVNTVTKLQVVCIDRAGLLAEIAQAIAQFGHNIQAYSGRKNGQGQFVMEYELEGDERKLSLMCDAIEEVNGVSSWSFSSSVRSGTSVDRK